MYSLFNIYYIFKLAKNTTPMYRAPEMLDLYQNNPINEQSDIWVRLTLFPDTFLNHRLDCEVGYGCLDIFLHNFSAPDDDDDVYNLYLALI